MKLIIKPSLANRCIVLATHFIVLAFVGACCSFLLAISFSSGLAAKVWNVYLGQPDVVYGVLRPAKPTTYVASSPQSHSLIAIVSASALGTIEYEIVSHVNNTPDISFLERPTSSIEIPSWARFHHREGCHYEIADGFGWPAKCLFRTRYVLDSHLSLETQMSVVAGGGNVPHLEWIDQGGYEVIGTGVVINAVLFVAIAMFIAMTRRSCIRYYRRRRNACVHCGYSATGLIGNKCPECGQLSGRQPGKEKPAPPGRQGRKGKTSETVVSGALLM